MKFFGESENKQDSPVLGVDFALRKNELRVSKEFVDFASNYRLPTSHRDGEFDIVLLSETEHPIGLYYYFDGLLSEEKVSRFRFYVRRKPETAPPRDYLRINESLGGLKNGFRRVLDLLPKEEIEFEVELGVGVIDKKLMRLKKRKMSSIPAEYKFNREHLNFTAGQGHAASSVSIAIGDVGYPILNFTGGVTVKLSEDVIESASEILFKRFESLIFR